MVLSFLYIGPGMGVGTLILVLLISGIVLLAVGYTLWARIKRIFKKVKGARIHLPRGGSPFGLVVGSSDPLAVRMA